MLGQEQEAGALELSRRGFFRIQVAGIWFAVAASCGAVRATETPQPTPASDDLVQPLTKAARDALSPDEIIARVNVGNERFRTGDGALWREVCGVAIL